MRNRILPLLRTIDAYAVDPDVMIELGNRLYKFTRALSGKEAKIFAIQPLITMLEEQGAYIDEQKLIRRRALLQVRLNDLIEAGLAPAGTTLADYEQMLADAEEAEQEQESTDEQPAQLSPTAERLIPEITDLMGWANRRAQNDTKFVKRMMGWLGKINLKTLSDQELKRLHNILNDYYEFGDLSDLGIFAARGEAQERLSRLTAFNNKFRQYKGDISKMSLNNFLENIAGSEAAKNTLRAELYQREEVLFLDTKKRTDDNMQALEKHITDNDMDERSVRATEIYNILAQAPSQNSTWQDWRMAMMLNWGKYLQKKLEEQKLMSSKTEEFLGRTLLSEEIRVAEQTMDILLNDFNPDENPDLESAMADEQLELAQMVRDFYAEISDEFRQNSAAFFSKLFDPRENTMYVSLNVIDRLGKSGIDESYSPTLTDTVFEEARIDRTESRTSIERTKFVNNTVVYGTDLLANFRKRYYQTLYQAKVSEELFVMDRMIKSSQFRALFDPKYSDRTTRAILGFMEGVVDGQRYFGYIGISDQAFVKKLVNGNIGAVLVDVAQYGKQSIGSLQLAARANYKIVGWALKSGLMPTKAQKEWLDSITTLRDRTYQSESLVSKQYSELNKFAGKTWARKLIVKLGDAIKASRNAFAKYTIEKADRFVSAAALFAGYAKSLNQQGLITNPSQIDWAAEKANPNFLALAAAENIADELNVPSNQTTKAEVLRSEKKTIEDFSMKEINWMLAQFDLNAYNNMRNNWRTIMDASGSATLKDKADAGVKVLGVLLNTQTYTVAKVLFDVIYQQAAIAIAMWILGVDFEDEDEEDKKRRQTNSFLASAIIGVFNLFIGKYGNIAKIIPRLAFATGFALFYKDKEQTEENKGTLKDPNEDLFIDPTGVPVVDLAVRQMIELAKAIKKENDAYQLAKTAGMFASFVTGFATIERITTKTAKEVRESPIRKDVRMSEQTDFLQTKKYEERKVKLFKYLREGKEDYAGQIYNLMVGPKAKTNMKTDRSALLEDLMDAMQQDRVSSNDGGAEYLAVLAYGFGLDSGDIPFTMRNKITGSVNTLKGRGEIDDGLIRRIVQRYEEQYQQGLKMVETMKEIDPQIGRFLEEYYLKGNKPGEALLPAQYSQLRAIRKAKGIASNIPE